MKKKILLALVSMLLASSLFGSGCQAPSAPVGEYPTSPIVLIVPWSPGGRSDTEARVLAPFMAEELGVPVVVANHPGAGGTIGCRAVAASRPDGYTIGFLGVSLILRQYTIKPGLDISDYVWISRTNVMPMTITVNADSPWLTLEDFVADAKANPGKIKMSTDGVGSSVHIFMSAFAKEAGIELEFIPYAGDAPAVAAAASGEVDSCGPPMVSVKAMVDAGKLRVLAQTGAERSPLYPDVPTVREELGIDWEISGFQSVFGPSGMSAEIVAKLEKAVAKAITMPEVQEAYKNFMIDASHLNHKETEEFIAKTDSILHSIVEDLGLVAK